MNFPIFIARRLSREGKKSFSRFIIRIAIVATALSICIMVMASSLINGFQKEISQKIFGFWGHIHITDTNVNRSFEAIPINRNQDFYPVLDTFQQITYPGYRSFMGREYGEMIPMQTNAGIDHIQSFILLPGIIQTKKQIEGIILKGYGSDFDFNRLKDFIKRGEIPTLHPDSTSNGIVLSEQTANRLKIDIGESMILYFFQEGDQLRRKFVVEAIYKTGLEEYDQKFALVDIRKLQNVLNWESHQVSGFEVFIDDIADLEKINEHIYLDVIPGDLYSESIRDKFPAIFEWLELQDINEWVILLLLITVAIINMITALMILILERSMMIGLLKSLGSTDWAIRKIFLYQAGIIIVNGLFWGNLIGLGLCYLQKKFEFIKLSEADYYLSTAPVDINLWLILMINLGSLLVILLFLLIPSYLVTKIRPVNALRFK